MNHFKGTFRHWDVNNESLRGDYYAGRFGNGINAWMYQYAAAQDPAVKLFPNETDTFEGGGTEAYKQQIQNLIASNAPVGGMFSFTDTFNDLGFTPGSAYYRLQWLP